MQQAVVQGCLEERQLPLAVSHLTSQFDSCRPKCVPHLSDVGGKPVLGNRLVADEMM